MRNTRGKKISEIGKIAIFLIISAALAGGCAGKKVAGDNVGDAAAKVSVEKQITRVTASENSDSIDVRVTGNQPLVYTSVKQPSPFGVILYFPETENRTADFQTELIQGSEAIDAVNITELTEKGTTARLAILLKRDVPYEVSREGTDLIISFAKSTVSSGPETAEETQTADARVTRLISISAEPLENSVNIEVKADGTIKDYKSFTIKNPARIVFDLFDVISPSEKEQLVAVDTKWVKQMRHYGYPDRVRIVLDTEEQYLSHFSSTPDEMGLVIQVGETGTDASEPEKTETAGSTSSNIADSSGSSWVNRVDFSSEDQGKSTVIIGTTIPVNYEVRRLTDRRIQVELFNTLLPDYRRRPLITTRFESAVDRITPVQVAGKKDTSMVVIELRESVPYFVEQVDNLLTVHFEASSIPSKTMDAAQLPDWQKMIEEGVEESMETKTAVVEGEAMEEQAAIEAELMAETEAPGAEGPKRYTGEKIALDFFETDIKNVFRILREISGKNFAIDRDVSGQVTLTLDKPAPWDQVLDLILKMNQLGMTMEGDIVRIATLQTLSNEREIIRQRLAAEQESKEQVKSLEPLITEYIPVNYAKADSDVLPQIVTTPERGSVTVDVRNNQIIITDTADIVEKARETVRRIDKVTPQVMIEARIVEASNTFSRALGTQWQINAGPVFTKELMGGLLPEGALDLNMSATNPVAGNGLVGINFTKLTGVPFELVNAELSARESKGTIKIISAPRILTLDNKSAKIKQGIAYPLTKLDADGNTTTEFQDVALELIVTPHVTPDNRITLSIQITNNELGPIINGETSFTSKEANTELLVNDGDTVVIGGIRKTTQRDGEDGIPVLMDIPVLSWLFKKVEETDDLQELLIFITPKIVLLEQRT